MNEMIDIPGFEGLYAINKNGEVWSYPKKHGMKIHKGMYLKVSQNLYKGVILSKNKKQKYRNIHKLLAETFIPNPENLPCVNHKNGIKHDNRLENLEWCTFSHNNQHAHTTGLWKCTDKHRISASMQGKSCGKKIMQLTREGILCKIHDSAAEAARITGFFQSNITYCALGKRNFCGGYQWQFFNI